MFEARRYKKTRVIEIDFILDINLLVVVYFR
jgi:hypothetical protein